MTMMEDYMDKCLDQYCTFEDNYFAHHDSSTVANNINRSSPNAAE